MRHLTILGGPQDGVIVPDSGPVIELPEASVLPDVRVLEELPPVVEFRTSLYHARQDHDGRWWYVHADVLRALR